MEMTILGCSGSLAGPGNAASGYLLRMSDGEHIVMDIGPGVLSRLQFHDRPGDVHVLFSHMHPDHCLDFPSLAVWQRYHPTDASGRVHTMLGPSIAPVHLGRASADALDEVDDFSDIFDMSGWQAPGQEPVEFADGTYPEHRIGSTRLYAATAVHPTESYLIRVEDADGSSLVYSGDTAATPNLAALASGADVLLCEATWGERDNGDNPPQMHLSGEEAGQAAAEAGVGRLILTHIPPWGDREGALRGARRFFDGPVDLAVPDMVVVPGAPA
ncbi:MULTISPECIES: MBL fold metallo-hydrolase [Corynebacterium]|jgi:ribonuclease BN (tRNA processing enzyme)|uniref:Ribonuclease Z n=1 Tax=Corynebacterium provencense TaxID=1737425 RepID=A0A2Z3YXG8_9CORY|nr:MULTISPECIES: MBL fold metallo-hydrolase [Corynebacterium]AWT26777.1 Ribonuclease Z [Corynebacterium provencense]MCI1257256.1 MBL fold metallo-hydrolase [Corynebacterium provencense]